MSDGKENLNDPAAEYSAVSPKRKITFFNSFEEAEEYGLREMASYNHEQRLKKLEILRKRIYSHLLLPDGSWPPLKRIITIVKG